MMLGLLLAVPSGVYAQQPPLKFERLSLEHGLSQGSIYAIRQDSRGRLWMSTNKGLARFDPQTESFRTYDVRDGLQSNEFNNNVYFQSRSGEMFFGGENGFNAFYPAQIEDNPFSPPFWRTWWFTLLAVLAVGVLTLAMYQARTRTIRRRNARLEDLNKALHENIAERRLAERERERVIAQLEAKNNQLEQFTYSVSHDLKAPLITIKGFVELLAKDVEKGNAAEVKTALQYINTAADQMHRLLNELLELSRVGRLMNEPEPVALTDLAHEAVGMLEGHIAKRGVTVDVAPDMPVVHGDRLRLLAVYQNLIDNAVKFMGDAGAPHVEVGARANGTMATCYVRDNGLGIATQHHDKIFGLFERLSAAEEGTGIGLALVKRIIEVHGGTIWVESDGDGAGSTFWFTLPKEPTSATP